MCGTEDVCLHVDLCEDEPELIEPGKADLGSGESSALSTSIDGRDHSASVPVLDRIGKAVYWAVSRVTSRWRRSEADVAVNSHRAQMEEARETNPAAGRGTALSRVRGSRRANSSHEVEDGRWEQVTCFCRSKIAITQFKMKVFQMLPIRGDFRVLRVSIFQQYSVRCSSSYSILLDKIPLPHSNVS